MIHIYVVVSQINSDVLQRFQHPVNTDCSVLRHEFTVHSELICIVIYYRYQILWIVYLINWTNNSGTNSFGRCLYHKI